MIKIEAENRLATRQKPAQFWTNALAETVTRVTRFEARTAPLQIGPPTLAGCLPGPVI
jgi:hypothetical protein